MPYPWPSAFSVSFSLCSHPHPWQCPPSLSDISSHFRLSHVSVIERGHVSGDKDCETCRECVGDVCVWGGVFGREDGGELCNNLKARI